MAKIHLQFEANTADEYGTAIQEYAKSYGAAIVNELCHEANCVTLEIEESNELTPRPTPAFLTGQAMGKKDRKENSFRHPDEIGEMLFVKELSIQHFVLGYYTGFNA